MIDDRFKVHRLNAEGLKSAEQIALVFSKALFEIEGLMAPVYVVDVAAPGEVGRLKAIVATKLQEACFFAKRAVALDPAMQAAEDES